MRASGRAPIAEQSDGQRRGDLEDIVAGQGFAEGTETTPPVPCVSGGLVLQAPGVNSDVLTTLTNVSNGFRSWCWPMTLQPI
jgi:hypothetical protein